jgi:hypothetical protein
LDCSDIEIKNDIDDYMNTWGLTFDDLVIQKGEIAPGFGSSGGGIQYQLPLPTSMLQDLGLIKVSSKRKVFLMKYEEAPKIIKAKNLTLFKWFEDPNYEPNNVGINKNGNEYEVYATSERGTPSGVGKFTSEAGALDNFIARLEPLNRLINKRPKSF